MKCDMKVLPVTPNEKTLALIYTINDTPKAKKKQDAPWTACISDDEGCVTLPEWMI